MTRRTLSMLCACAASFAVPPAGLAAPAASPANGPSQLTPTQALALANTAPSWAAASRRIAFVNDLQFPRDIEFRYRPIGMPLASIRVSSLYGIRRNPFGGDDTEFHPGVDFAAPTGTPVLSTGAGIVSFVGPRDEYGLMVEIQHRFGYTTRYAHLSGALVRVGQKVERGTQLGEVGSTGRSTGPHLYFEIWHDGSRLDPIAYVLGTIQKYHLD